MPGGGNLVRSGRYKKSPRTTKTAHARYYYTRSLVLDSPRNTYTPARCHSAPRVMDSHSRSASPRDANRPQHRPPSPPATPKTFDNRGYQHDEADQNHNDSFSSNPPQQNGHSKEPNGDTKTLEAVNLELINLTPKNGHTKKKDVEVDMSSTNPYDEYFVPVNEHRKYMRGEKLYVTADKRGEKGGCKRPLCWTLGALLVAAIVALIALAATGVLFSNSPTPLEQYNSTLSSARAFGGVAPPSIDHTHSHEDDHEEHDGHVTESVTRGIELPRDYIQADDEATPATSEESADLIMYVPHTVEGALKIDNEEFTPAMKDPESEAYKEFASNFAQGLKRVLFNRSQLENGDNEIAVEVVKVRKGSVLVSYRIHWKPKNSLDREELLTPASLKAKLDSYLDQNSRMISIFHIAEDKMTTRNVLDLCQINKNDCEYGCAFEETTLDFICTCPRGQILDIENPKKCMSIFEQKDGETSLVGDSSENKMNTTTLDPQSPTKSLPEDAKNTKPMSDHTVFDWKEISHITAETTTEGEPDPELKFSHIFGHSEEKVDDTSHKTVPKTNPESESYPIPEPEPTSQPEPAPEPEPTTEPEPSSEPELKAEPKSDNVDTAQSDKTPESKSDIEPTGEPETKTEFSPISAPEPTPEPKLEPEYTSIPELTAEPKPEPKSDPQPTAESKSTQQSTSFEFEPKIEQSSEFEPTDHKTATELNIIARNFNLMYEEHATDTTTEQSEFTTETIPEPAAKAPGEISAGLAPEPTESVEHIAETNEENASKTTRQPTLHQQPNVNENEQPEPHAEPKSEETTAQHQTSDESNLEIRPDLYMNKYPHSSEDFGNVKIVAINVTTEANNEPVNGKNMPQTPFISYFNKNMHSDNETSDENQNLDTKHKNKEVDAENRNSTIRNTGNFMDLINENMNVGKPHDPQERSSNMPGITKQNTTHDDFLFGLLNNEEDNKSEGTSTTKSYPITTPSENMNDDIESATINEFVTHMDTNSDVTLETIKSGHAILQGHEIEQIKFPDTTIATFVDSTTQDTRHVEPTTEITPEFSIKHHTNSFKTEDNIINALDIKSTTQITPTTEKEVVDEGTEVTFDEINMLYNRSSKSIQNTDEEKGDENVKDIKESETTIIPTESDWLSVPVTEINYSELMNKMENVPTTESQTERVDDIMGRSFSRDDFEPDYLTMLGTTKSPEQDMPMYGMIQDYDNEEQRVKRVNQENKDVAKSNEDKTNTGIRTSSEYITENKASSKTEKRDNSSPFKNEAEVVDVSKNETTMINTDKSNKTENENKSVNNEPAPVWESEDSKELGVTGLSKTEDKFVFEPNDKVAITTSRTTGSDDKFDMDLIGTIKQVKDVGQNASEINNLNVTIYEKPSSHNQTLDSQKSTIHSAEFTDHEKDPNPFLPEVENNNSLVKKLIEGHDLEPINMNDTQNETTEEVATTQTTNAINKSEDDNITITDDKMITTTEEDVNVNDLLNTNIKSYEKLSIVTERNTKETDSTTQKADKKQKSEEKVNIPISSFLQDTDDLVVSGKERKSSNVSIQDLSQNAQINAGTESDLRVVPIPDIKETQRKNLKKESIENINNISDSPKKSDRRTIDTTNLESEITNEA